MGRARAANAHYSHSRQLRSNVVDERRYWEQVPQDCGFCWESPMTMQGSRQSALTTVLCCLLLFRPSLGGQDQRVPQSAQRRVEEAKGNEGVVEFYGKVVDQFGVPVAAAAVKVHVIQFSITPTAPLSLDLVTDGSGSFGVAPGDRESGTIRGTNLSVAAIGKEGYEECRDEWPDMYITYLRDRPDRYHAEKAKPLIYRMRKRGTVETFLLQEVSLRFQVTAAESAKAIGYDFVQRGPIRDVASPAGDDATRECDLQVKATFSANGGTWTAILAPGDLSGGIIVSDQLLYEAPETGYQPEYSFTPEDRKPLRARYVYLKSRDPAIYTRFEVEYVNANKEFFRLGGKSVTNPYGDRNLEQATHLPYEVMKRLTDDARTAFRQSTRPAKPDLPKLVREAKEKAARGDL